MACTEQESIIWAGNHEHRQLQFNLIEMKMSLWFFMLDNYLCFWRVGGSCHSGHFGSRVTAPGDLIFVLRHELCGPRCPWELFPSCVSTLDCRMESGKHSSQQRGIHRRTWDLWLRFRDRPLRIARLQLALHLGGGWPWWRPANWDSYTEPPNGGPLFREVVQ